MPILRCQLSGNYRLEVFAAAILRILYTKPLMTSVFIGGHPVSTIRLRRLSYWSIVTIVGKALLLVPRQAIRSVHLSQ